MKRLLARNTECVNGYAVVSDCPQNSEEDLESTHEHKSFKRLNDSDQQDNDKRQHSDSFAKNRSLVEQGEEFKESSPGNFSNLNQRKNIEESMIVKDTRDGIDYMNMSVFRCNNIETVDTTYLKYWETRYTSKELFNYKDLEDYFSLGKASESFMSKLYHSPPRLSLSRPCQFGLSCESTCGHLQGTFGEVCQSVSLNETTDNNPGVLEDQLNYCVIYSSTKSDKNIREFNVLIDVNKRSALFETQSTRDGWDVVSCSSFTQKNGGCNFRFSCKPITFYNEDYGLCVPFHSLYVKIDIFTTTQKANKQNSGHDFSRKVLSGLKKYIRFERQFLSTTCGQGNYKTCTVHILYKRPEVTGMMNVSEIVDLTVSDLDLSSVEVTVCYNTSSKVDNSWRFLSAPTFDKCQTVDLRGSHSMSSGNVHGGKLTTHAMFVLMCLMGQLN